jgi:hypothetical protein
MAAYPNYQAIVPAQLNLAYKWKELSSYEPVGGLGGASPDGLGCGCPGGTQCDQTLPEGAMNGLGIMTISPVASFIKSLGDDAAAATDQPPDSLVPTPQLPGSLQTVQQRVTGAAVAAGALALSLFAVAGYYAGKAMAPPSSNKSVWGWFGVGAALLAGPLGLGVLGAVSLTKQDEI